MRADSICRIKNDPVIRVIYDAVSSAGVKAYLVGGALRNLILSRPLGADYDVVMDCKVMEMANLLGKRLQGSPFLIDKAFGSYRISIKRDSGIFNIDLSSYNGKDIMEDLNNRDFTINAMAVDINTIFRNTEVALIDIFSGQADAENKTIREVKPGIFDDDPLRLLRAVRISAQYDLTIDKTTERYINTKAELLTTSSWERIRDEFFIILECQHAVNHLKRLYELSLLHEIIPEIRVWDDQPGGYNLVYHAFKTLEEGEWLMNNLKVFVPEFAGNIDSSFRMLMGNVSQKGLFKLALFIHDAGKPETLKQEGEIISFIGHDVRGEVISKQLGRRLKLSRNATAFISKLVRNHHRVFNLAALERLTDRSKAHLFRVMGEGSVWDSTGAFILLLTLADARATRGGDDPELAYFIKSLIAFYYKIYLVKQPRPILNGNEIMDIFNIPEGVAVGRLSRKLAEAEGVGIIKNKKDAVKFLKNLREASKDE